MWAWLPCGDFLFLIPKAPRFFFHGNREAPGDEVGESSSHPAIFEITFYAIYFEMTELSHEEFKKSLFQTFQSRGVLETLKVVEV